MPRSLRGRDGRRYTQKDQMKPKILMFLALVSSGTMDDLIASWTKFKNRDVYADAIMIVLAVFISAYLTGLLCRFVRRQGSGVHWYLGLIAAMAAGGLLCLLVLLGFHLQSGHLAYGFIIWIHILKWLPVFLLPPAAITTWYYRKRSQLSPK